MTVNKERVQLLVDALRSGEFRQGKDALRTRDGERYCCLGVATEVARRNGLSFSEGAPDKFPWDMTHQVMCVPVARWFGLEVDPLLEGPLSHEHKVRRSATTWNDELDASFDDIANMFENTYIRETAPA